MSDCEYEATLRDTAGDLRLAVDQMEDDPEAAGVWSELASAVVRANIATRAAADHIAAQRAEIARLTRERDEARAEVRDAYQEGWDDCARYCESPPHTTDWGTSAARSSVRAADKALAAEGAQ